MIINKVIKYFEHEKEESEHESSVYESEVNENEKNIANIFLQAMRKSRVGNNLEIPSFPENKSTKEENPSPACVPKILNEYLESEDSWQSLRSNTNIILSQTSKTKVWNKITPLADLPKLEIKEENEDFSIFKNGKENEVISPQLKSESSSDNKSSESEKLERSRVNIINKYAYINELK